MASPAPSPKRPVMPMKKRITIALVIVLITVVPAMIMIVITYLGTRQFQSAALWASIPAIAGLAATVNGGRRFGILAAIVMGLLAPLSIVAGLSPVSGAALMALLAMLVGRLARFGLNKSALLVPAMLAWPLIDPPLWAGQMTVDRTDDTYLLWMALIFFVGGLFPAFGLPLIMRKRQRPALSSHSRQEVVPYTVIITVLVTVSTFYVLSNARMIGGAFLIATIVVLAPLGTSETLRPTLLRVFGTLLGSFIVVALVAQVQSLAVIYLFGLVFIVIALIARFGVHGWIYYVFMTPATASLNATTLAQFGELGQQRLVDNIVGGILVLIGAAAAITFSSWSAKHGHTREDDPETLGLLNAREPVATSNA